MASVPESAAQRRPSMMFLFTSFFKIGAFTFGGGLAMLPLIRRELVVNQGWLTDEEFLDIIGIAQCSPGPIAVNTAVFSGLKVLGLWGALAATVGVVLPSLITISVIAAAYTGLKSITWVEKVFQGVRPAVAGLIAHSAWTLSKKSIKNMKSVVLFLGIVLASLVVKLHPALAILLGGVCGYAFTRPGPAECRQEGNS